MQRPSLAASALAEQRSFGAHVLTEVFAVPGSGARTVLLPFLLLPAGVALLLSELPVAGVVLFVAAPAATAWSYVLHRRVRAAAPRLHCFEGGIVLDPGPAAAAFPGAGRVHRLDPGRLRAHAWSDVDAVDYQVSPYRLLDGEPRRYPFVDLRGTDGVVLVTVAKARRRRDAVMRLAQSRRHPTATVTTINSTPTPAAA